MATQTLVVVTSDLSGAEDASTRKFMLDGAEYEIDLTPEESAAFEATLAMYVASARRTGGRRIARQRSVASSPQERPGGAKAHTGVDSKVIRAWASESGVDCPTRGRIPLSVQEAFLAAKTLAENPPAIEPVVEAEPAKPVRRRRARAAV